MDRAGLINSTMANIVAGRRARLTESVLDPQRKSSRYLVRHMNLAGNRHRHEFYRGAENTQIRNHRHCPGNPGHRPTRRQQDCDVAGLSNDGYGRYHARQHPDWLGISYRGEARSWLFT